MRALSAQQIATLNAPAGYSSHVRVRVLRGSEWLNLSELGPPGLDFLLEAEVSESVEAPVATATVRCAREVHGFSLAPLVTTSALNQVGGAYAPLLSEGCTFIVETAVSPLGMVPTEWLESFRGRIDSVDAGGDGLSFEGRDYGGGLMQDRYIEAERDYGNVDPVHGDPVQDVMNAIVDDNTSLGSGYLHTPTSPGWNVGHFLQRGESVLDALEALAQQLGWEVRWKWSSSAAAFQLTFWSPDRAATVPVRVFTAAEYQVLGKVETSLADVRNAVEVVYSDAADLDVAGQPKRKTVLVSDSGSIAAVGRRFMRLAEAASSNIDSSAEATTLANAALADLKDKPLGVEVDVDFHPELELGDLVAVEGNGYHFTATQTGAVRALTHTFNASGATTKLTLLGKPSTSVRRWLSMEQRPTTAPASPFTGPAAPTGLTSATTAGGFKLSFSPPTTGAKAAAYELHVSTSSGFTPSDSTRRVVGNLTEVVVTDLSPGTTYYAKVVARDLKGNRGPATSEVTLVPRYVEPRTLQPFVEVGSLVPNDSFEAANDPAAPPDTWTLASGTWGTTAMRVTSQAMSGAAAIRFVGGNTNQMASQYVTARPGEVYSAEVWAMRTAVTGTNVASLLFDFVDASFALIGSSTSVTVNPVVADGWERFYVVNAAPAGTRYIRVRLNQGSAIPDDIYWDSVRVREARVLQEALQFPDGVVTAFANSFDDVSAPGGQYTRMAWWKGADDTVHLQGRLYRTAGGAPAAGTSIVTGLPSSYRPLAEVTLGVPTDTGIGVITITAAGSILYQSGGVGWLSLDGINFRGSP